MEKLVKDGAKVDWTDENKRHFITAMLNEAAKGNFVDNGFKKQSWHAIQAEFRETSKCPYDKQQLHSHYGVLKKKYHIYKALKENSGFGVDPNNGGPTAADDVWLAYLKAHPDASQFRGKPFLYFDDLDSIFTGKVASGKYSKASVTPSPAAFPGGKRPRDMFNDESWVDGADNIGNYDVDNESIDSSVVNPNPVAKAARACPVPVREVKPVPVKTLRPKPGAEITGFLGKIIENQDRIVQHNMADSKLDQALKIFSTEYSTDLSVVNRLQFKKVLSALPATSEMFLQLDEEERVAFIQENIM